MVNESLTIKEINEILSEIKNSIDDEVFPEPTAKFPPWRILFDTTDRDISKLKEWKETNYTEEVTTEKIMKLKEILSSTQYDRMEVHNNEIIVSYAL